MRHANRFKDKESAHTTRNDDRVRVLLLSFLLCVCLYTTILSFLFFRCCRKYLTNTQEVTNDTAWCKSKDMASVLKNKAGSKIMLKIVVVLQQIPTRLSSTKKKPRVIGCS